MGALPFRVRPKSGLYLRDRKSNHGLAASALLGELGDLDTRIQMRARQWARSLMQRHGDVRMAHPSLGPSCPVPEHARHETDR